MGAAKAAIVEAIPVASEALAKNVELGTRDVAQRLGKSENWVRARWQAGDLPGRKVSPNRIIFTESAIQQYVTTTRRVTTTVQARAQPDLGPRAAAIYERLEKGESVSTIVRELEEAPSFVAEMRAEWRRGYDLDREGLVFRCACGAASNPHTAKCDVCAPRSLTLSDAQLAALSDLPPPVPETCRCSGCGSIVGTHAARHICATCRVELGVLNGALVVTLGGATLRQFTAAEVRTLLESLFPRQAEAKTVTATAEAAEAAPVLDAFQAILSRGKDPA